MGIIFLQGIKAVKHLENIVKKKGIQGDPCDDIIKSVIIINKRDCGESA